MTDVGDAADFEIVLDRARAGEDEQGAEARGRMLEQYRAYLTLLARVQIGRRLQGKVDAADVVQETFLEAHRHFGNFRGTTEAELTSWLRQILAGTLAHLLRHYLGTRGRDVRLEMGLTAPPDYSSRPPGLDLVASLTSPSLQAARREEVVLLADALERLPEEYREVIVLRHWEGLTFPEVAGRMGRSQDSVEKLWLRALARLRQVLGGSR